MLEEPRVKQHVVTQMSLSEHKEFASIPGQPPSQNTQAAH